MGATQKKNMNTLHENDKLVGFRFPFYLMVFKLSRTVSDLSLVVLHGLVPFLCCGHNIAARARELKFLLCKLQASSVVSNLLVWFETSSTNNIDNI